MRRPALWLWVFLIFTIVARGEIAPLPAIDFSHAGYGGGGVPLPVVPALTRVTPTGVDDTAALQAALDWAGQQAIQPNGFRGAVLLASGEFRVSGSLRMARTGVVLRGSTNPSAPTIIVATGQGRRTLLVVGGEAAEPVGPALAVLDDVAAGATSVRVSSIADFQPGDRVSLHRPSTKEWIEALGMNQATGNFADQRLHWLPGSRDLMWDRTVVSISVERNEVTLDAPITTAIEQRFGGGSLRKVSGPRVHSIGIEHLRLASEHDPENPLDEEHAWIALGIDHAEDVWVTDIAASRFVSSAVRVGTRARRVTIENCRSESPVSELANYRRQSFVVEGQQVLVRNCSANQGLADFITGQCAAGPNVFLDCRATDARGDSGSFESWSSGTLFENVSIEGADLRLTFDMERTQGGGWTAANSVVWNCRAGEIEVRGPENAPVVRREADAPLYRRLLEERKGADAGDTLSPRPLAPGAEPAVTTFTFRPLPEPAELPTRPVQLKNGRFVVGGRALWGAQFNAGWWKGQTSPAIAAKAAGRSITRWAPGRIGPGLTEDLRQVATDMEQRMMPFYAGGPGLWYDRRRDDHLLMPRPDANVWAPFFELPWARSGRGTAWDGLSQYDLSRFNPWFFSRTAALARLCDERGLVLYHNLYNTHNILETYAHYTDYAWRTANCINEIGIPEPPPLDERNTVHLNDLVYNVDHPERRRLHRAYIRHTLDQLGAAENVVFSLAFQFAGPLAFQEFFLDTIAEWQREHGRRIRLALVTSKDITDAILANPKYEPMIDVVDLRYWQRQSDGKLWAPRGDVNRAFREQNVHLFGRGVDTPPHTTPLNVYRGVREYRDRYPDKAIVAWHGGAGPLPVLMAGGAQALLVNPAAGQSQGSGAEASRIDDFVHRHLTPYLADLTPRDGWVAEPEQNFCLAAEKGPLLIHSLAGATIRFAPGRPAKTYREATWFNPQTGEVRTGESGETPDGTALAKPDEAEWLVLLR